jgi:hypothetical protein
MIDLSAASQKSAVRPGFVPHCSTPDVRKVVNRATIGNSNDNGRAAMAANTVVQGIAAVIALGLYFLPAILADRRKRHDLLTIALFNACLGWTGFGWFVALHWALQPNPPKDVVVEVEQTRRVVKMRNFSVALIQRVQSRATRNKSRP